MATLSSTGLARLGPVSLGQVQVVQVCTPAAAAVVTQIMLQALVTATGAVCYPVSLLHLVKGLPQVAPALRVCCIDAMLGPKRLSQWATVVTSATLQLFAGCCTGLQ